MWKLLYEKILEGDIIKVITFVFEYIIKDDFLLNGSLKTICISLLLLAVLAGVFGAFIESFDSKDVSKMGCFMIHLLLFSILVTVFWEMLKITKDVINAVLVLMNAAIPIYYMAVCASGNLLSGYTYYRVSILSIYAVEQFVLWVLLPFMSCYMILSFGNALWMEKKLSVLTDFIKKTVSLSLKTIIGGVSGISFLQSMVAPMVDGLKNNTAKKAVAMIPGVGNLAEGMTELTFGSLVLIKNSVGLCIFFMLIIVAAVPVIKLLIVNLSLKLCAALMAVIADKNIATLVLDTAETVGILLKIVLTVLLLFVVSMAIVLFTTNG